MSDNALESPSALLIKEERKEEEAGDDEHVLSPANAVVDVEQTARRKAETERLPEVA